MQHAFPILASAELLGLIVLAAGVTAIASVAFAVWFVCVTVKGLATMVGVWPMGGPKPVGVPRPACPDPVCRAVNPGDARFCRQCGRMLRRPESGPA